MKTALYNSLVQKIYDNLIANPEFGLGEMGACRDEASRIVDEWMEDSNLVLDKGEELIQMPNGFTAWHETHFEIVQGITFDIEKHNENPGYESTATQRHDVQGHGGLYELAREWTDEFEDKYKGKEWGMDELDYFETVEGFVVEKLKVN